MQASFQKQLLAWFDQHGRHDLPWQTPRDAYRVWLSEVMLQQTQVATVIPYFKKFIHRFPTVQSLAAANIDDLLALWAGLGYYTRAKNLHKAARLVDQMGAFPNDLTALMALPGVGRSTAGAILAQAFNQYGVILDGNVRRVLIRFHALHGDPTSSTLQKSLWELAEHYTPKKRIVDYSQAIMDLGAMVCTRSKPQCPICPLNKECRGYAEQTVNLLPNKRIAKKIPLKSTVMLVIQNAKQQLCFIKRPLSGLWNGLWCLPMLEQNQQLTEWLNQQHYRIKQQQTLPTFRHTFSHFALDISVLLIDIHAFKKKPLTDQQWFTREEALQLGIPAPVKKILVQLHDAL